MDKKIDTTRAKLIKAYEKWNEAYKADPDGFVEDSTAEEQVDYLIKLLEDE